ncbi:hypothetical protein D3C74_334710 [compost metagenome]
MSGCLGDILHHGAERLHHGVIIPGKLADLILAAGRNGFIQLALTYPFGRSVQRFQRCSDPADNEEGNGNCQN